MLMSSGTTITRTDRYRTKFSDVRAEVLYNWALDGSADETSGSSECPTGWFARIGRHLVFSDERGFVWSESYPESLGAALVFWALDRYYNEWSYDEWDDGEEDRSEAEQSRILAECDKFLFYVVACARENLVSFDFDAWVANDRPTGPLG